MTSQRYQASTAVVDTSALIKNPHLLELISPVFKRIVLPDVCMDELSHLKDKNRRNNGSNEAWLALNAASKMKNAIMACPRISGNHDDRIVALAEDLARQGKVVIITDDIDFQVKYHGESLTPAAVLAFLAQNQDSSVNAYLKDGSGYTQLIDAIHQHDLALVKKLLAAGADPNLTDCSKYFLTPLSHAIKANDFEIFDYLIKHGADINKGSINEGVASHVRLRNEGNTPLMIACWHGKVKFVQRLLKEPQLCLNQQDSNGYTALIKCAIKGHKQLFDLLLNHKETDRKIRDRCNHDAFWFLENGHK